VDSGLTNVLAETSVSLAELGGRQSRTENSASGKENCERRKKLAVINLLKVSLLYISDKNSENDQYFGHTRFYYFALPDVVVDLIVDEEVMVMGEIKVVVVVMVEVIKCGRLIKITQNRNK
jgi:hypothetical protein